MKHNLRAAIVISLFASTSTLAAQQPVTITAEAQQDLAVTLYSDNLGLIQDTRALPKLDSADRVVVRDVSQQMQTETLQITNAGRIKEQTLNSAVVNYHAMLTHYLGKQVTLSRVQPSGQEIQQNVTLLSVDGATMLVENNARVETVPMNGDWRIIFPEKPSDLLIKPSLTFRTAGTEQPSNATLSYLSSGLRWQMDYVMTLNEAQDRLNIDGLASLMNNTGTALENARFRLLAGDVNQVRNAPVMRRKEVLMAAAMADESQAGSGPQNIGEYKLYTLPEPITLQDQQRTQVPLLSASNVPVQSLQRYQFYVGNHIDSHTSKSKPENIIRFKNSAESGLDKALPGGNVRMFAPDGQSELHYIGGAQLPQTSRGEQIELSTGAAFDVTITRKQTAFENTFDGAIVEYELTIKNAAAQPRQVEIGAMFSQPWKLESSTFKPTETSGGAAKWAISASGKTDTIMRIRVRLTDRK